MLVSLLISILPSVSQGTDTLLQAAKVTYLKESVSLERVPSPVSLIRKAELQTSGAYRSNMLSDLIPGLHIPDYGASLTSTIYLRGLGSRMENPVMGLYLDGIPVLDKNAYAFDWAGIRSATMLRGPQGTLYGRNAMSGVMSLQSLSPSDNPDALLFLEYGTALSIRASAEFALGNHILSASFRHTDGFFTNEYKQENCDPYDGFSFHWKWEQAANDRLWLSNSLWATLSQEGGFAYGLYTGGNLQPVSYNDEGSYRRLSVIDGQSAKWKGDVITLDAVGSVQVLADDMRMDQDYTPASIFTLQQRQLSGAATIEVRIRRSDPKASWQPQTGLFALYKLNHIVAPVTFKRDGIQRLILDNANSHIPASIGYLDIPDPEFPVDSDFLIGSWNTALFHESVFSVGKWQFTAGIRLDYEGSRMDYDCLASLHYRFVPTMNADKAFSVPYRGSSNHAVFEVLPKFAVLFEAPNGLSPYLTVSRGYRAGGFNTQIFSDILQNKTMNGLMRDLGVYLDRPIVSVSADNTEYDPETAWNYELGARLRKKTLRLEFSAYYIAVRNLQMTVFPPGMSTGRMMTNSGRSRSIGAEAELSWKPGNFRAMASLSWCNARSDKYIPYIPLYTAFLNAGYSFPLGRCSLETDVNLRGNGPIWWDEDNTLREPFRLRLGARLALAFPRWEIFARGENLSDTKGSSFYFKSMGNEFFARTKPRIIMTGISIKLK